MKQEKIEEKGDFFGTESDKKIWGKGGMSAILKRKRGQKNTCPVAFQLKKEKTPINSCFSPDNTFLFGQTNANGSELKNQSYIFVGQNIKYSSKCISK